MKDKNLLFTGSSLWIAGGHKKRALSTAKGIYQGSVTKGSRGQNCRICSM